jgi:hypothetical protein
MENNMCLFENDVDGIDRDLNLKNLDPQKKNLNI